MMKKPEQLKGAVRNLAKTKGIHAQEVLQIFMFANQATAIPLALDGGLR